mmetsp:Transcript_11014/g.29828  ORF Transcript_11014/g.29828 Transcript_11014/m.29828 type:complete len:284 (-) Transcript_11014:12-863(-)
MPRDHYAVLGVERDATEEEIKKAYKRAALKWHPDKNMDDKERAEKVFKEISQAYVVLSDPEKKAHYDRYGDDEPRPGFGGGGGGFGGAQHRGGGVHPDDLTPEDVFNMFFGIPPGARRQQRHYTYAQPGARRQQGGAARTEASGFALVQVLPLLLLLVMSFISSVEFESAPFELKSQGSYRIERETERAGVKYFVPESFDLDYAHSRLALGRIEEAVEQEVLRAVSKQCTFEKKQQTRMFEAANAHSPGREQESMLEKAHAFRTLSCEEEDRLRRLRKSHQGR